ncbi:hypothetical protein AQS8620_00144 [Aquimixticola soesokkakensis]|uniref:Mitochondrial inner membrane protein n=1 Tax=Aquimixticola soesokkakensis TaxID=1519096 RepID=A0A1Y5RA43_9RHOB|nr:hypothetical protein [Aquimixticola soesokkakensis]SLN12316.1 hypothetical protein AQS8620_00144 [Aquimixticola soesokkakensis]
MARSKKSSDLPASSVPPEQPEVEETLSAPHEKVPGVEGDAVILSEPDDAPQTPEDAVESGEDAGAAEVTVELETAPLTADDTGDDPVVIVETSQDPLAGDAQNADEAPLENDAVEEPVTAAPAPMATEVPKRSSGFAPLFVGGLVAACLGFAAAVMLPEGSLSFLRSSTAPAPQSSPETEAFSNGLSDVQTSLQAQNATIAELQETISALSATPVVAAVPFDTAQFDAQISALSDKIDGFDARITALEAAPTATAATSDLSEEYAAQLAQMKETLASEMQKLESEKLAAAQASDGAVLRDAVLSGAPFAQLLPELTITVPDVLVAEAESGVPTLSDLETAFPDAARTALEVSIRATTSDAAQDRIGAFFKTQLGVRSLTPKEGSDPDAILSRAEAKLKSADLDGAISEISALPQAGQAAMADWVAMAQKRSDAVAALATLENK